MEVIYNGKENKEEFKFRYILKCHKCKSVIKFTRDEVKYSDNYPDTPSYNLKCPVCNKMTGTTNLHMYFM